jgi:hypothetical protein
MNIATNTSSDQMRRETERFLGKAMRTVRNPREAYERLVRELNSPAERQPARRLVPARPAA